MRLLPFPLLLALMLSTCGMLTPLPAAEYPAADVSEWYDKLMMPDHPGTRCCGEGDAYFADDQDTDADGNLVAIITDTRPDGPRGRIHIPPGTRVVVPPNKRRRVPVPNPTDHTIIFLGSGTILGLVVYCYEPVAGL